MTKYLLGLILILLSFTGVAVAQPIYGWKDEKGQWFFSDVVSALRAAGEMNVFAIRGGGAPKTIELCGHWRFYGTAPTS